MTVWGGGQETLNANESKVGVVHISSLLNLRGIVEPIDTESGRKMNQEN